MSLDSPVVLEIAAQSLVRVLDVGGQRGEQVRDPVAAESRAAPAASVADGHAGHQGARRQLAAGDQPAAQGTADDGQHHVVHGDAVRALDLLDLATLSVQVAKFRRAVSGLLNDHPRHVEQRARHGDVRGTPVPQQRGHAPSRCGPGDPAGCRSG